MKALLLWPPCRAVARLSPVGGLRLLLLCSLLAFGCAPKPAVLAGSQIDVKTTTALADLDRRLQVCLQNGDVKGIGELSTDGLQIDLKDPKVADMLGTKMLTKDEKLEGLLHQWYGHSVANGTTIALEKDPSKDCSLTTEAFPEVAVTIWEIPHPKFSAALFVLHHKVEGQWKVHSVYRGVWSLEGKTFPQLLKQAQEANQAKNLVRASILAALMKEKGNGLTFGEHSGFRFNGSEEAAQLDQTLATEMHEAFKRTFMVEGKPFQLAGMRIDGGATLVPDLLYVSPVAQKMDAQLDNWAAKLHQVLRSDPLLGGELDFCPLVHYSACAEAPLDPKKQYRSWGTLIDVKSGKVILPKP